MWGGGGREVMGRSMGRGGSELGEVEGVMRGDD